MKLSILAGSTSQSVNLFIQDSSSTTGAGLTGLVYNTASLTAYYTHAGANATATAITLATLAAVTSAYSSGGFKEIDATNMPGWYRFDIPNACLATSKGRSVAIHFKGVTNMAPLPLEIELTATDNQDGVRFGLTALPNAAAASGGLLIYGTGSGGQITTNGSGLVTALLSNGTGTGQIALTSGAVILYTTQTFNNTGSWIGSITGNLSGSVGSVTGLTASNLDVAVSTLATASNLAIVAGYIDTEISAIKAKTDNLPAAPAAVGDIPTASAISDVVWDELLSGHAISGSTGAGLSAAGSAGDPWSTTIPGAYGAGTAGYILGSYLTSVVPTATQNADALLKRDWTAVSGESSRSTLNALRFIRNGFSISGSTLTVLKEDDTTSAYTRTLTTNAAADPVTGVA